MMCHVILYTSGYATYYIATRQHNYYTDMYVIHIGALKFKFAHSQWVKNQAIKVTVWTLLDQYNYSALQECCDKGQWHSAHYTSCDKCRA